MQQTADQDRLPTIDDFVEAMKEIRRGLEAAGIAPTVVAMRPGLERFATECRERYLAGATNAFDLEQRQRKWERAQISGLFSRKQSGANVA